MALIEKVEGSCSLLSITAHQVIVDQKVGTRAGLTPVALSINLNHEGRMFAAGYIAGIELTVCHSFRKVQFFTYLEGVKPPALDVTTPEVLEVLSKLLNAAERVCVAQNREF